MSYGKASPKTILCLVAGIVLGSAAAARACTVSLGVPGNPPFASIEQGEVTGIIAEVTVLALRQMGCRVQPRELPFARMYKWVHGGKLDVATAVRKTPKRATLAHYSPPIMSEFRVIMVPKGSEFTLRSLGDLAGKDLGAQLGFYYPRLSAGQATLMRARNFEININRVARGRLDGTVIGSITGPYTADRMALADRVSYLPKALTLVHLGAALSNQSFSQTMRDRFDAEIRSIIGGRIWHEILAANELPVQRKVWPLLADERQP